MKSSRGFRAEALKINKNTVEMLNNGLRALLSIKRILSTIKSVNELTGQAFPQLLATSGAASSSLPLLSSSSGHNNSPKMRLVSKIFGGGGGGGSASSGSGSTGKSPLSTASLVEGMAAAVQGKRSNALGLIKIGEKPPPGLFPETLPYSINGQQQFPTGTSPDQISSGSSSSPSAVLPSADLLNAVSALTLSSSNSNSPLSTSELFSKLVAAASAANLHQSSSSSSNFNSDSESIGGSNGGGNSGGSISQLIPHFSASDLKTSSSDVNTSSKFELLNFLMFSKCNFLDDEH
ncbi:hypothetical protein TYRP_016510 [Tyrophagus putrescentiae]|nr:hypothetical protein TYRP_016510 [Tyrophagus putrescentiae]